MDLKLGIGRFGAKRKLFTTMSRKSAKHQAGIMVEGDCYLRDFVIHCASSVKSVLEMV